MRGVTVSSNDQGFSDQLRPSFLLDRGEKGIHVNVKDPSPSSLGGHLGSTSLGHPVSLDLNSS
jgi:hypothetical protein